ncbi:MAG TPA: YicC family protein [Nitrospirae bacterium]|nr:YicC family protein [Nitrospirota bacterium]
MEIQSMTGYGEAEGGGFKVELKSINHRYLDIHFKMPRFLLPYEMEIRGMLKEHFQRGRIDVSIALTEGAEIKVAINERVAEEILVSLSNVSRRLGLESSPSIDYLFWFRDAVFFQEPEINKDELMNAVRMAIESLREMRVREGEVLVADIRKIIGEIERHFRGLEASSEGLLEQKYEQLKERLKVFFADTEIDETRIIQEAALLAEKADIREELTRFRSHLEQLKNILHKGGIIGRRIDFLLQELLREVNTMGSKCADYEITDRVVKIKTEIEKVREQIQNIQ